MPDAEPSIASSRSQPWALVTGATVGIGAEFARQLAQRGHSVVLVGRNEQVLRERSIEISSLGVDVETIVADLLTVEGVGATTRRLEKTGERAIGVLVNNAGYGLARPFEQNSISDEQKLLDLLVSVPMSLSHTALTTMLPKKTGLIINIASVAGFTPRGTYGASKGWILSFSRWANIAYGPRGIQVTAVAPGFVYTEFHDRMNIDRGGVPAWLWLSAETMVRLALRDIDRGKAVSVPTIRYKLVVLFSGLLPKRIVAKGALRGR